MAAAGLIGFIGNELVAVYRIRVVRRIGSAGRLPVPGVKGKLLTTALKPLLRQVRSRILGSVIAGMRKSAIASEVQLS